MKKIIFMIISDFYNYLYLLLLVFFSCYPDADNVDLECTYLGNQGFLIEADSAKIMIDGIFREGWGKYHKPSEEILINQRNGEPPFDHIDLMLITHNHPDHFNAAYIIECLANSPGTILVGNNDTYNNLKAISGFSDVSDRIIDINPTIKNPIQKEINGISLKVMLVYHAGSSYTKGLNLAYLINTGKYTIFHSGDAQARNIEDYLGLGLDGDLIDLAMIPIWFFSTKYGDKGYEIIKLLNPELSVMTHVNINKFSEYKKIISKLSNEYGHIIFFRNTMDKILFYDRNVNDSLHWALINK